ncbi:hypothetical protein [Candidatus Electronema sp. PJ]|uniref:hypothetical protein n=1 Tax=Candidatus Electronema sp. PJ TaxID=3401572 RepID=UPI003AA90C91
MKGFHVLPSIWAIRYSAVRLAAPRSLVARPGRSASPPARILASLVRPASSVLIHEPPAIFTTLTLSGRKGRLGTSPMEMKRPI